jgi:mono/diheme cytochrome c family protein
MNAVTLKLRLIFVLAVGVGSLLAFGGGRWVHAQEIHAGTYPQTTGQDLFQGICQGCHMPDAQGAVGAGAYPALAHNARLSAAVYPVTVVVNGQRAMPSFGEDLTDEQIANVVNYVRSHFGNRYKDGVTPAQVKAARR